MSIVHVFTKRKPATAALAEAIQEIEDKGVGDLEAAAKDYSGHVVTLAMNKRPNAAGLASAMAALGKSKTDLTVDTATMKAWHQQVKIADAAEPLLAPLEAEATAAAARYREAQDRLPIARRESVEARNALRGYPETNCGKTRDSWRQHSGSKTTLAGIRLQAFDCWHREILEIQRLLSG
jgi:hypothetical protein